MDANAIVQLSSPYGLSLRLIPIAQPRCILQNSGYNESITLYGYFTSTAQMLDLSCVHES